MGCHPNPIDFHSIIFQDGEIAPATRKNTGAPFNDQQPRIWNSARPAITETFGPNCMDRSPWFFMGVSHMNTTSFVRPVAA